MRRGVGEEEDGLAEAGVAAVVAGDAGDLGCGIAERLGILVVAAAVPLLVLTGLDAGGGGGGMSAEALAGESDGMEVPLAEVFLGEDERGGGGGISSAALLGASDAGMGFGGDEVVDTGIFRMGEGESDDGSGSRSETPSGSTRLGTASSSLGVAEALGVACSSSAAWSSLSSSL